MPLDSDLHDIRSMLIGATAEFSCAFDAPSMAAIAAAPATYPWRDFGHVKVFDLDAAPETTPRITAVRGNRRQKGTEPTLTKLIYKLTMNEADALKVGILYAASEIGALTQAALTGVNGAALDFTVAPSQAGHWYDLRTAAGAQVRELSDVTIAGLVEDTDFVVDLRLGRIRFLTEQSTSLTPVLTAAAITSSSATSVKRLTPMAQAVRSGYCRLTVFDKKFGAGAPPPLEHRNFSADITLESGPGSQDGTSEIAIVIMVTVTFDEGELNVRV